MQIPHFHREIHMRLFKGAGIALGAVLAVLIWGDVLRQMLGILFGAALIAFLLSPVCNLLEKKLTRPMAALTALILAAAMLLGSMAFLLPALLRQLMQLCDLLPEALGRIGNMLQRMGAWIARQLPGISLPQMDLSPLGDELTLAMRSLSGTLGSLADGLYRIFLSAVLSYFLISDRQRILLRLELLVPQRWRCAAVRSSNALLRQLRMYLRGQITIALAVGALACIAMALLGLRGPLLLGLMVGACNVIPYFGPFLGGIPAVAAALGIGWQRALLTVLALFLLQQIDGLVISPRVMGSITGFSPAVVLLALFAGARIGGIAGMLLALPVLMAFRTVYRVFVWDCEKN